MEVHYLVHRDPGRFGESTESLHANRGRGGGRTIYRSALGREREFYILSTDVEN